jgi:hypothetical protein
VSLFDPRPPRPEAEALAGMAPEAARFLSLLRLWLSDFEARAAVWNALAARLGARDGRAAMAAFEEFVAAAAEGASRRIARRPCGDPWVSADEAALARALAPPHPAPGFVRPEARAGVSAAARRLAAALEPAPAAGGDLAELGARALWRIALGGA